MFRKKSVIVILIITLVLMLITGCSEIIPGVSLELEKGKPDSLPEQALDNQQATANLPDQAQAELPFGAVPIKIVLSWGTCNNSPAIAEFQARLVDPDGNTTYASASGENKTVTISVDSFIPGTYYYYVVQLYKQFNSFTDMSFFDVNVIDAATDEVLNIFDVSDATGTPGYDVDFWKVFTFDGDTGVITSVNEIDNEYATPW